MTKAARSPWRTELDDLLRGVAGAFLFGAPFLYTMEMWWKGNFTSPPHMLIVLVTAYVALVLLDLRGGFRSEERARTWPRILTDCLEALAIALLSATLSLFLIGVINLDTGLEATMGRIIMEALPFSIGVGIANNVLSRGDGDDGRGEAYRHRFRDPRSRPYRTADGGGVLLLFDSGTTTQLCHFAVSRAAQGRGMGRRVLELARGLVPAGRPLWLFTAAGGSADRAAAAAGWELDHTASDWILDLDPPPDHA